MDLRQLENIVVISEEQSISRAAERLFISQPALSQQLNKLETQLGTPLFYRGNRYLTLTPAGAIYVRTARQILAVRRETYTQIHGLIAGNTESITVGVSANRSAVVLSSVYPKFFKNYPDISIQIIESPFLELETMVLNEKLDLAFTLLSDEALAGGVPFSHASLTREPMHLAVSWKHSLAPKIREANERLSSVDLTLFQDQHFASSPKRGKLRTLSDTVFSASQLYPQVLYETFNVQALCSVVELSNLCTLLPSGYFPKESGLVHAPVTPELGVEFALCWNKAHKLSAAEQHFILLCQEYCQQNIQIS